jgi:hypothetical protein
MRRSIGGDGPLSTQCIHILTVTREHQKEKQLMAYQEKGKY